MASLIRRKDEHSCAGYCDACSKPCMGRHEAGSADEPGSLCYHCGNGHFRLRAFFTLYLCPSCGGKEYGCEECRHRGVIAVPAD